MGRFTTSLFNLVDVDPATGGIYSFSIIQTDTGTYPTADGLSDILTFTTASTGDYFFSGSALTDTVTLNINTASGSQKGLLSSTDWNTFNNKVDFVTSIVNAIIFG